MSEKKGIAVSPNKLAMSRALGAAFLNHQVEQLEKSVTNTNGGHGLVLGPGSGNWRNRRQPPPGLNGSQPPLSGKRPPMAPGIKVASKGGNAKTDSQAARKARAAAAAANGGIAAGVRNEVAYVKVPGRGSMDREWDEKDKDADVIVVDASVLIHALYQVKKWCRDGRPEILIVPLEALNTLDLLKKGTTPLAQRARAASRILEAQVGTNSRIRVQQDDAFVLWDKIAFNDESDSTNPDPLPSSANKPTTATSSPEWVRRTICCAKWEAENTTGIVGVTDTSTASPAAPKPGPTVALAVLSTGMPGAGTDVSPRSQTLKLSDSPPGPQALLNPVPLPAPAHPHSISGGNKFEPRSSGALVAHWAGKAGIKLLEVEPTRHGAGVSEDEGRGKRAHGGGPVGQARRGSSADGAVGGGGASAAGGGPGLVERPPAVRAMMEMVAQQPSNTRVVRVLARGEKLDP